MASENTLPDDGPALDPFEVELVAYLDGELDPVSAQRVEARLAKDPVARARAAELKKSFELLDYLPKPDPSPTFTTRTLDKLPPVKSTASGPPPVATAHTSAARPSESRTVPSGLASTSMPLPLELDASGERLYAAPSDHSRPYLWVACLVAAVVAFAALGYFATALFRRETPTSEHEDAVDARVIENLPLYAVADDLAFVTELTKPDLFGDDPAVAFDPTLKVPRLDPAERGTGKHSEALTKSYRALSPARQTEIVKLDQQVFALEPPSLNRHLRALEAYAVWLQGLQDSERRGVLAAATPGLRLDVIRKIRDQQWRDALPSALRAKPELIQQWREEEAQRRDRLAFIRQHAESFVANKSPWPFDTDAGRKEVLEFARNTFKTDDPKRCRLTPEELAEYKRTLMVAERDGVWAWYGLLVYEMSKLHPYLPESDNPKLMITEQSELPSEVTMRLFAKKGMLPALLRAVSSKWPDFPLEAHREITNFTKFVQIPALGPARLSDFKEPVRRFANDKLFPKLTGEEKTALQKLEGKWPEYPQRFIQSAHKHDLAVPGVTLPGSPKKWDITYGTRPQTRPTN